MIIICVALALAAGADPTLLELVKGQSTPSLDALQSVLSDGEHPDTHKATGGWSALMWASFRGHTEAVRLLMASGADFGATDPRYGQTALSLARVEGHGEVVLLLEAAGGAARQLHELASSDAAAPTRDELDALITEFRIDPDRYVDADGATALLRAAERGYSDAVALLLARGAAPNATNKAGVTPLMRAAARNHGGVLALLLEHAADAGGVHQSTLEAKAPTSGSTALLFAVLGGHTDAVEMLLKHGANANVAGIDGMSALMVGSRYGNANAVRLLLSHGATVEAANADGTTALTLARQVGRSNIINMLQSAGQDVQDSRDNGRRVWELVNVAAAPDLAALRRLLQQGTPPDGHVDDKTGETALITCAGLGHADAARLLLEHGANAAATDTSGWTALDTAKLLAEGGSAEHSVVVEVLQSQ